MSRRQSAASAPPMDWGSHGRAHPGSHSGSRTRYGPPGDSRRRSRSEFEGELPIHCYDNSLIHLEIRYPSQNRGDFMGYSDARHRDESACRWLIQPENRSRTEPGGEFGSEYCGESGNPRGVRRPRDELGSAGLNGDGPMRLTSAGNRREPRWHGAHHRVTRHMRGSEGYRCAFFADCWNQRRTGQDSRVR